MKMSSKTSFRILSVALIVICFSAALIVLQYDIPLEEPTLLNASVMTAEGTFDRVELVDRHFGDWNGQEVEGALLAVLYEHGSVEISRNHYEVRGNYANGTNYPFFLYIYDGVDHLRERISVEGETLEEFVYLNVTVTILLGKVEGIRTFNGAIGTSIFLVAMGGFFIFLVVIIESW